MKKMLLVVVLVLAVLTMVAPSDSQAFRGWGGGYGWYGGCGYGGYGWGGYGWGGYGGWGCYPAYYGWYGGCGYGGYWR